MNIRIGIVGAGAVGCVVGGMLTRAGEDVTLIDQWPQHVDVMQRNGLTLTGTCGDHKIPVKALHLHQAQSIDEPFDAVFIAVKSYDTEWATRLALSYLKPEGYVVDFQNGINDYRVAALAGAHRSVGAVILIGAGMYEPGVAMRTDTGQVGFKVGEHDGRDTARVQALAKTLSVVAPTEVTTNLFGERWSKLSINCMVNPLAGLSGLGTSECRTEPGPRRLSIYLAAECIRVGRACGFEVEPIMGIVAQRFVDAAEGRGLDAVEADISNAARKRGGGRPSMLQDVMRRRRTEIEQLNGFVADEGRRVGIPTPFNDKAVELYRAHGVGKLRPDPKNLEPLLAMLPQRP